MTGRWPLPIYIYIYMTAYVRDTLYKENAFHEQSYKVEIFDDIPNDFCIQWKLTFSHKTLNTSFCPDLLYMLLLFRISSQNRQCSLEQGRKFPIMSLFVWFLTFLRYFILPTVVYDYIRFRMQLFIVCSCFLTLLSLLFRNVLPFTMPLILPLSIFCDKFLCCFCSRTCLLSLSCCVV